MNDSLGPTMIQLKNAQKNIEMNNKNLRLDGRSEMVPKMLNK